jgi:hypothetical protein
MSKVPYTLGPGSLILEACNASALRCEHLYYGREGQIMQHFKFRGGGSCIESRCARIGAGDGG